MGNEKARAEPDEVDDRDAASRAATRTPTPPRGGRRSPAPRRRFERPSAREPAPASGVRSASSSQNGSVFRIAAPMDRRPADRRTQVDLADLERLMRSAGPRGTAMSTSGATSAMIGHGMRRAVHRAASLRGGAARRSTVPGSVPSTRLVPRLPRHCPKCLALLRPSLYSAAFHDAPSTEDCMSFSHASSSPLRPFVGGSIGAGGGPARGSARGQRPLPAGFVEGAPGLKSAGALTSAPTACSSSATRAAAPSSRSPLTIDARHAPGRGGDRRHREAHRHAALVTPDQVVIRDMAVNPATRHMFFSVSRGRGATPRRPSSVPR